MTKIRFRNESFCVLPLFKMYFRWLFVRSMFMMCAMDGRNVRWFLIPNLIFFYIFFLYFSSIRFVQPTKFDNWYLIFHSQFRLMAFTFFFVFFLLIFASILLLSMLFLLRFEVCHYVEFETWSNLSNIEWSLSLDLWTIFNSHWFGDWWHVFWAKWISNHFKGNYSIKIDSKTNWRNELCQ